MNPLNVAQPNLGQLFNQFRQNPFQMLIQQRYQLPQGINSAQGAVQYLVQSGQINPALVGRAQQLLPQFQNLFR